MELTDSIDLHTFAPAECADVVGEYVCAAHEAGFRTVRVIHGKGRGTLRTITHAVLAAHPLVAKFALDERGNWGATVVDLVARSESGPSG